MNPRDKKKKDRKRLSAKDWLNQPEGKQFESTSVQLPDGIDFYKLEPGTHKVDFLSYRVTKGRDEGGNPRADSGFEHYERGFVVHRVPSGGKSKPFICREETFGKKCAVCQWLNRHAQTAEKELVESLKKKYRCLWIVNDKPGSKKPKLKILETFRFNRGLGFEELMNDAIAELPEDTYPFSPEGGCTATIVVKEQTFPGGKTNTVTRIRLDPHDYDYPDSLVDEAPDLDECLIDPGVEKVAELLERGEDSSDEEDTDSDTSDEETDSDETKEEQDETEDTSEEEDEELLKTRSSSRNGKPKREPTAEDLDLNMGDIVIYRGKECSIKKISGDGTSLILEGKPGELFKAIAPTSVEKYEGPDEEDDELDQDETEEDEGPDEEDIDTDEIDDEESEDDFESEDDESDEDIPPAKSKGKAKGRR